MEAAIRDNKFSPRSAELDKIVEAMEIKHGMELEVFQTSPRSTGQQEMNPHREGPGR